VTPVRNAINMAKEHEGARVLVQDAPGHCSGQQIPSRCTWGVISDFFNHGRLPEEGKVCGVDQKPWDDWGEQVGSA
jgi:TAP-like protein